MLNSVVSSILLNLLLQVQQNPAVSRDVALERFEFRETHMGSEIKLILYTKGEPAAREASRAVFDRFAELNRILSDYEPDSELNRFCDRAGGPPVAVSEDLFRILSASQAMSSKSDGAFDVTIKPLTRLWRRAFRQKNLPDPEELARARALVNYRDLCGDVQTRTFRLARPGMRIDLGGIAKGFACDEGQRVLQGRGIDRALIAAAGDIVVSGPPPDQESWTVGVGPLEDPTAAPQVYLRLRNAAVSTSGDTERFAEIDGQRYSHIVDPRTGLGKVERASVTVVAPHGATADSLATAVYLLGPERGLTLAEEFEGVSALYVRKTDDGLRHWESAGWQEVPKIVPEDLPDPAAPGVAKKGAASG